MAQAKPAARLEHRRKLQRNKYGYHTGRCIDRWHWLVQKTFVLPVTAAGKNVSIEFDGIYRNSEVWINGHYLGKRPYGYSSFSYDLTRYLHKAPVKNTIVVKVDNSQQPNSRWYSGSGIYRNTRLVCTNPVVAVKHWGTFITTSGIGTNETSIRIHTSVTHQVKEAASFEMSTDIYDPSGKLVSADNISATKRMYEEVEKEDVLTKYFCLIHIKNPKLWSVDHPYLYKAVTKLTNHGKLADISTTNFGIRSINFDAGKGFFLNSQPLKIKGVCNHHDLGALGAAVNVRAIERQLQILKAMAAMPSARRTILHRRNCWISAIRWAFL